MVGHDFGILLFQAPIGSRALTGRLELALVGIWLGLMLYAIVAVGPEILVAGWPAWVLIGGFGLANLLLAVQRNRFAVFSMGIAPTYKPWRRWTRGQLVVPIDGLADITLSPVDDPSLFEAEEARQYFGCDLTLKDGTKIRFGSHGFYRGLRRQLRSDEDLLKAYAALEKFERLAHQSSDT